MADTPEAPEENQEPAKKSGLMTIVKALAFVSVVVLIEVAAASMLLPTAEDTEALGEKLAAAKEADELESESAEGGEQDEDDVLGEMVEVNLGSYHVLSYNPETGTSLSVDFELYGTVLSDDESEFTELYLTNEQRIFEQVNITVRGMDLNDLTDPQLGLIKRKILEKTNRALGKPLLHEALVPGFSFIER